MSKPVDEKKIGACYPLGFEASGVEAGIKGAGLLDLCVLFSAAPATAAGVFTTNLVLAAPVRVSQHHLLSPHTRAVVISSGNANAATGPQGLRVAEAMCEVAADVLECKKEEVLIAQTGLIGIPLDEQLATGGTQRAAMEVSPFKGLEAATAMMTTDTTEKIATASVTIEGKEVRVGGMAKGAAMLSPSMATMLAVVTTDAAVSRDVLRSLLQDSMHDSFHSIVVDGCRSTNDTVFLLANSLSGAPDIRSPEDPGYKDLQDAIRGICRELATQMVKDAEGSTRFLTFVVNGAASEGEARLAARTVVSSVLVKCSLAGSDAYWGRVISELGASGATFDPDGVQIFYGGELVCKNGVAVEYDRKKVMRHMGQREILIEADLRSGSASATAYGCDLTYAYLDENMGTS